MAHSGPATGKEAYLMQYAANALLTSWADVAIADNLVRRQYDQELLS